VTEVEANAAKIEPDVPKRQHSDEEVGAEVDERLASLAQARLDAAKGQTAASPVTPESVPTPPSASAGPAPAGAEAAPKAPPSPEELARTITDVLGPVDLVRVSPDDPRIPAALRIDAARAANLKWRVPEEIVGVVCGCSPQPLFALVFTEFKQFKEFKETSLVFKDASFTMWPRERLKPTSVLWLRSPDGIPRDLGYGSVTWVGAGIVPVAVPTWAAERCLRRGGPVPEAQFSEIKWPSDINAMLVVAWYEEKFGPRYRVSGRKVTLNTTFWARFAARTNGLKFMIGENVFFVEREGKQIRIPDEDVLRMVMEYLRKMSTVTRAFPTAGLRPSAAKQVVEELKVAVATRLPARDETLAEFLDLRVERRGGHSLTVEDLYAAYYVFCKTEGRPRYWPRVFTRMIAAILEKKFGVLKSHDLEVTGDDGLPHARRGFHGLRLKEEGQRPTDALDGADVADAPDGTAQTSNIAAPASPA
jgi:hypothetical protein